MQDINLYHLLKFYAKKWYWIAVFTAIGALAGYIYSTHIQVPLYKSDATLLLVSTEERKIEKDTTLINNYIELLKSRRVLEPVIGKLGHKISYDELVRATTATNEKDTEVIKLNIASKDPETSKKLVEGVVVSFREQVKELYKLDNINVVDNANKATQPYNVHTAILTLIATLAGLTTATILLFFAYDLGLMQKATQPKARGRPKKKLSRRETVTNKIANWFLKAELKVAEKEKTPSTSRKAQAKHINKKKAVKVPKSKKLPSSKKTSNPKR